MKAHRQRSFSPDGDTVTMRPVAKGIDTGAMAMGRRKNRGRMPELCEFCFTVPSFSIHRIQETHETLLHILWDLIHVVRGQEDVI